MAGLQLADVSIDRGGVPVLENLSFNVEPGARVALLGSSGSGKTSILELILGLLQPSKGSIVFAGRSLSIGGKIIIPAKERRFGFVMQEPVFLPHLTVSANVGLSVIGSPVDQDVIKCLEVFAAGHLAKKYPYQLSAGEQGRVALARAMLANPKLVLLDEAFHNFDTPLRYDLYDRLSEHLGQSGGSLLLVTHDYFEACSLASEVLVIRNGSICFHGTPQKLYDEKNDGWLRSFVGRDNLLNSRHLECLGNIDRLEHPTRLRPEDIIISDDKVLSQDKCLRGMVNSHRSYGFFYETVVDIVADDGGGSLLCRSSAKCIYAVGRSVILTRVAKTTIKEIV